MQVTKDCAVALKYKLTSNDGVMIDSADKDNPLWFIFGKGQLLPKFEQEISGLSIGDSKKFTLTPAEGYGEFDPKKIVNLKKDRLSDDNYKIGSTIILHSSDGHKMPGKIIAIDKESVKIDLNHDLAGETLHFNVSVLDIRRATKEELAHGHIHGSGCHH